MKMTLNKLIANDIINYGMDQTTNFNYSVYLDEYIDEYDEEGKKYILEHLDQISDAISNNENISYYSLEEDEKLGKYFDMVFYWGKLLNSTEMIVLKNADLFKIDLNLEDVREIASELVDDDDFNDALINLLKKYDKGKELE